MDFERSPFGKMPLWIVEHIHLHKKVPVLLNHNIWKNCMLWLITTGSFFWRKKCSTKYSDFLLENQQLWGLSPGKFNLILFFSIWPIFMFTLEFNYKLYILPSGNVINILYPLFNFRGIQGKTLVSHSHW